MKENIKNNEILNKLIELIKKNKGIITPNEAIASSGYSKDEVITSLNRLLELYEVKVNLNANTGALQYVFKYPLFQRGSKTFAENMASVASFLYKIFKQVYKVSIGVVLIAYTIIFALILIAISFAGQSNDRDNGSSGAGLHLVGVMFRAIFEGMYWHTVFRPIEYAYDPYGNRYKTFKKEKKGAGFIKSVFQFVFGPEEPKFDPLADAREVAAYIRLKTKGKLTSANIIELSGADYSKADSKLAEYAGKFSGDLEISNDGVLYGEFSNIMGNVTADEIKNIEYYQDEVEPPVEFTGNTGGRNTAIVLMNAFNLIMSFVMLYTLSEPVAYGKGEDVRMYDLTAVAFLAYVPMVISSLYFIIPLIRIPSFAVRKKNRNSRVLHKKLVGYICSSRRKVYHLSDFIAAVVGKWSEAEVQSMLERIVVELDGKMEIDSNGNVLYTFERLYNELVLQ
ncbi:MAG: hypothetical protein LBO69_00350 [Ignavibacteria bacterium]|jgi:hypothetical protein|nr:hypothetical protein [Ignavibacteria bacterium]